MNILMLGRWLPPPRRPVKATREYQFARELARSHHLTLAFINDNPDAAGVISALRSDFGDLEFASVPRAWRSLAGAISLATGESCTLSYFRSEALRTRLAERLRRAPYDAVLVTSSSMLQYALGVDRAIPLVVDFGSVDSEWWAAQGTRSSFPSGQFFRTEAARLRAAESAAAKLAARCIVATSEAARIVQSLSAGEPTAVIPNGLDLDFFGAVPRPSTSPTVILNAAPGVDDGLADIVQFCREVVPLVKARFPKVRFIVSTRDPLAGGKRPASLPELEIAGPATDLRALFHSHAVAAAPAGSRVDVRSSVLEPMAAGIPVVAGTYLRDELGAKAGGALLVCETAFDFGLRIIQLLEDAAFRVELGARGRAYAAAHHAWSVLTPRLAEIVESLAKPTCGPPSLAPAALNPRTPLHGDAQ
jgi:glycosyltransferase involved in cell wall biosynthesis